MPEPSDPYAVLGVEPGAPLTEIKRAYRKLARTWHPDRNDAPEAEARFREIADAWALLSDPEKRRRHDLERGAIARGEHPEPFIADVADAMDRAERWIREGVLPHIVQYQRGQGAEMAARFLAEQEALSTPGGLGIPTPGDIRRAKALGDKLVFTAWMRPSRDATVLIRGRDSWEIALAPGVLWDAGFRDTSEIDDAVMRLLLARTAQVVAFGRLPHPELELDEARAIDDAMVQRQQVRWAGWALVAAVLGGMLIAGYNQW